MINRFLIDEMEEIALSMFRKNFFGIFHGSISARVEQNRFIINKKDAIFDRLKDDSFIELYSKKDYRWNDASIDADIHANIYKNISEAKYITYTMPPFVTAYSLDHDIIVPKDYFGYINFKEVRIYDPKQFDNWYERAEFEIYNHMKKNKTNMMVIKGFGIYTYARDMNQIAKSIAILENSCKILKHTK